MNQSGTYSANSILNDNPGNQWLPGSLNVLEQLAAYLQNEMPSQTAPVGQAQCSSPSAGTFNPPAISEVDVDAFIRDLNAYVDSPSSAVHAPPLSLEEIERRFLQDLAVQQPAQPAPHAQAGYQTPQRQAPPPSYIMNAVPQFQPPGQGGFSFYAAPATLPKAPNGSSRTAADSARFANTPPASPGADVYQAPNDSKSLSVKGKKKRSGALSKLLHVTLSVCILVVIVFSLFVSINQASETPMFGYRFYNVISNSMDGMIDKGSLVLVKETPHDALVTGDVITFNSERANGDSITHQIVEVLTGPNGEKSFVTKGYNNAVSDPDPVRPGMILGKVVFHLPFAGTAFNYINRYMFLIIVIVLVAGAVFLLFFVPNMKKKSEQYAENETAAPTGAGLQPAFAASAPAALAATPAAAPVFGPANNSRYLPNAYPLPAAEPKPYAPALDPEPILSAIPTVPQQAYPDGFDLSASGFRTMFNTPAGGIAPAPPAAAGTGVQSIEQIMQGLQDLLLERPTPAFQSVQTASW